VKVTYPRERQLLVEEALEKFLPRQENYPDIIYRAMRHSLLSGGKRFRPILALASGEVFNQGIQEVMPTACAIEYIHTYSLIHDDLPAIDDDRLRRGKPTCHVLFGEDVAILAGDALFAEAFYLVASAQRTDPPSKIIQVIEELASASGIRGMVKGQVADIFAAGKEIDASTLDFIHSHKTGRLITAAARVGGILGDASEMELETLTQYAHHLGLAFQITDDILDVVGEEAKMGKAVRKDEQRLKATFPAVFGVDRARELAKESVDKAKNILKSLNRDVLTLKKLADFVYLRES